MNNIAHQSQLAPADNKFHQGVVEGEERKFYWLTPWDAPEFKALVAEFGPFDFDPCPYPKPDDFDGLTCEWGQRNYVNPPFGSIMHQGPGDKNPKKKGPTAWIKKAIVEWRKGKRVVIVFPLDKWVLMILKEIVGERGHVRNLGDVRWLEIGDRSVGKGTGRHIACFILEPRERQ